MKLEAKKVAVNLEREGLGEITVRLSERNLIALLSKLYMEGSARTIQSVDSFPFMLTVIAEKDEHHYKDRLPAGEMSPQTERDILELKRFLEQRDFSQKTLTQRTGV